MKLSLVVPCYNEAENVAMFQDAVIGAFADCGYDYEIIFVNDGSCDATLFNLKKLFAAQRCPVKVVSFSRNFGKESAIYAGMAQAAAAALDSMGWTEIVGSIAGDDTIMIVSRDEECAKIIADRIRMLMKSL